MGLRVNRYWNARSPIFREIMKFTFIVLAAIVLAFGGLQADERNHVSLQIVNHTTSGYIKQGCVGLTFITSSGFSGTVGGSVSLASSTTYSIPIPAGTVMNDVSYTVTGGTLTSVEVR